MKFRATPAIEWLEDGWELRKYLDTGVDTRRRMFDVMSERWQVAAKLDDNWHMTYEAAHWPKPQQQHDVEMLRWWEVEAMLMEGEG